MAIPGGEIGPNTSEQVCPNMFQPSHMSQHSYGTSWFMAAYTQFMAFWGRFEPSWRPPMAILGGKIDPNTLAQVCLDMFQSQGPIASMNQRY